MHENLRFEGIPAAPGIAVGQAYVLNRPLPRPDVGRRISPADISRENERLLKAVASAKAELLEAQQSLGTLAPEQHLAILAAYVEMVSDEALLGEALQRIERDLVVAELGLTYALDIVRRALAKANDPYLSARAADLDLVEQQILHHLQGGERAPIQQLNSASIVVARHLSPADAMQLRRDQTLAFAADIGGSTSHTAIVAQSLGVPAVVGLKRLSAAVQAGDTLIVDGDEGVVVLDPSPEVRQRYEARRQSQVEDDAQLLPGANQPALTLDGARVEMRANVELLDDVAPAMARGADGIGLYRTEFVYLRSERLPSEQAHYEAYSQAVTRVAPLPVTIRTLDLGGDKLPAPFHRANAAYRTWSLRGIRLSLAQHQIFKQQLRAIARAAALGPVKVLFPMVSGVEEIERAREILDEVYAELGTEGVEHATDIPVGAMIEVPAAATIADHLAQTVDFFSIGTNDLIHYTLAFDRGDEHAVHLYQPLHPAVLRLIHQTLQAGKRQGIPVLLCGEMAREASSLFVLIGLGLREFSVNAAAIPRLKALLRRFDSKAAQALSQQVLQCRTAAEVAELVRQALSDLPPPAGAST